MSSNVLAGRNDSVVGSLHSGLAARIWLKKIVTEAPLHLLTLKCSKWGRKNRIPHSCALEFSDLPHSRCPDRRRGGYGLSQFRLRCGLYMSCLSLAPRWAAGTVLYQEGPEVHVAGVRVQIIGVFHWVERVISNSETYHRLCDPVAEAGHVRLAEVKGTVGTNRLI